MNEPFLLDDAQMTQYLRDGFVVFSPEELGEDFHDALYAAACEVHDEARAIGGDSNHLQVIGDNLRARIPRLEEFLYGDTVQGALRSVLGDDFVLHPHHFVHEASTSDQSFHQDGNLPWNDRAHYRSHRPNWAMLFYYPQAVTLEAGPTEVLPGTQYWTTDFEKDDGTWHRGDAVDKNLRHGELANDDLVARDRRIQAVVDLLGIDGIRRHKIEVPAGGAVLAHYDLMHRGSRMNAAFEGRRFMYKFYYFRARDPETPTWCNGAEAPVGASRNPSIEPIVDTAWHWLRGETDWCAQVVHADQVERIQCAKAEDERVRLAYEIGALARHDGGMRHHLRTLLFSDTEALRRNTVYAIGIAGSVCEPIVMEAMASPDARVRRVGAYAAGEARIDSSAVIEALFALLEADADDLVRSNAAYALGLIGRGSTGLVSPARLLKRLDPAVEADNTTNGGMYRSTVRVNVIYAVCNLRALDNADLQVVADIGLKDRDRYVRGLAVALLERHALARGEPWMGKLVAHLAQTRFNDRPPRPQLPR
ncbi:MAG: phytanoyl-CoA dioxygenase family protein [Gammaproteobacteria bacterium]|nr:phytanoyl-CoA dioxygenase family protein [Gammaproteobacteria bacterium]